MPDFGPFGAFYNLAKSLVEEGLTANAILETASELGIGIRRARGLEIVRGLREVVTLRPYISSLKLTALPNPFRFPKSVTSLTTNFSYTVRAHPRGMKPTVQNSTFLTVVNNELLTKNQALGTADAFISENLYPTLAFDYVLTVTGVLANKDVPDELLATL